MKTPLLFVKLPRHVVENLQSTPSEELQLVLGGKERITTGTLHVGQARYDVRYSNERSSAPPLLFQGSSTTPDMGDGWARWTQCGRLMGKLTVLNKGKQSARTHISNTAVSATSASLDSQDKAADDLFPQSAVVPSASKSTPQKKPGIFRQNREILREKILHTLALAPAEEAQVLESAKPPQNAAVDILNSVGRKSGSVWSLRPEKFRLVQIDSWQTYSKQDRLQVADNALRAFDELNLAADDADRVHVEKLRRRLELGLSDDPAAETPAKGLTKTTKKKPMRSVIAPTLSKARHLDANKSHKRPHGLPNTGSSAPPTAVSSAFHSGGGPADTAPAEGSHRGSVRANKVVPLLSGKSTEAALDDNVSNEAGDGHEPEVSQRWPMASAPPTAASSTFGNGNINYGVNRHMQRPQAQSKHSRHASADYHPASDAETEYGRRPRGRRNHSPGSALKPISRSHSRSSRRSPPEPASGREGRGKHRPVRSRPLQFGSLVSESMRPDDAQTDAAVHRVQEKLAQKMQWIPVTKLRSRSSSDPGRRSALHRPRGPSLSPIPDLPRSPSPAEEARVEPAETVEDLDRIHTLLTSTYAEYSQLRLQIDSHCSSFEALAAELAEAQAACNQAMAERLKAETEREEGEEVPDDSHAGSSLGFRAVTDKCTSDGARLYWMETSTGAWLADGPDAIVGQDTDRGGYPCRLQKLLPEEERVLKANQAIVDQYIEMGSEDVRRWVRRYLRLHAQIELMNHELTTAYQRIYDDFSAQYDLFRDELGDSDVDAALADADVGGIGAKPPPQELNIDMYKDNVSASLSGLATAASN
ncbi:hypothetical protein BX667DRAFT_499125 [Coemansia mojavensis]|nr:hypothetical protein BX667DRAFT_499125 [Coemansia mojavensis]KAJ1742957.1 hypothetical protein LPJ68_001448 [Coemansia sp. RSA 1086]